MQLIVRHPLVALSLATLLPALGTSIANVALPDMARAFAAPLVEVQWVVVGYLVAVTSLVVTAGRLGDLYGRRRVLLAGTALFGLASAGGMLATGLWSLVALRTLQGVGAAAMMALTLAMAGDLIPKARSGRAFGLLATVSAVGTALGPSLGGVLVEAWGWRAVFAAMALAAGFAFAVLMAVLPGDRTGSVSRPRLDLPGIVLLSSGLALAAFAASRLGHGNQAVVGGLGLPAFALLLAFVRAEQRVTAPLVDLSLLTSARLWPGLLQMMLVSMIVMTTLVVGPFYLSRGLGLDPVATGLLMSVGPGVVVLIGVPAGRLVDRFGTERLVLWGLVAATIGSLGMAVLPNALGASGYAMSLATLTAGYGIFQTANGKALLAGAPADRRGTTSGLLALARNIGLITGAAAMGPVYALGSRGLPGIALAPGAGSGLMLVFCVAAAAGFVALALSLIVRRHSAVTG
ncbi:MFS transporter [Vannielia litorea]|uniref:Major Facilitator Superfamily protein n=1 Tax=Vannielia litorea TaxID=1217970 RepID=A0A1N6IEF1_9RHOB|nr:MFS transporter [Vannielia litorea]SIO30393.1 Major Facilitator Superfamily protein [Vannielia litorea]